MPDADSLDAVIRRAIDPITTTKDLPAILGPIFELCRASPPSGVEVIIQRLAEEVIAGPTRPGVAGMVAVSCGAFVERGTRQTIAIAAILDRLETQILPNALRFVAACHAAAAEDDSAPVEPGLESERPDPVTTHGEPLAAVLPVESESFHAIDSFTRAANAILARSPAARRDAGSRPGLRATLDQLGGQYGYAGDLWKMTHVLEDEPLIDIHVAQGKGYRVLISGLADNYQLHTLLADALIGWNPLRWLRGERPPDYEVAAMRDSTAEI